MMADNHLEGKTMIKNVNKVTDAKATEIGKTMEALAVKLASKADQETTELIVEQMEAKETLERGPILVMFSLEKAYGQEFAAFPRPGSTYEETDTPDLYKVTVPNPKGGSRTVNRSFYIDFADNTREGMKIVQELRWIKLLRNPDTASDLSIDPDFRKEYGNLELLKVRETYLTQRRATIRNAYKKAIAFSYAFRDILTMEKVDIRFRWADEAKTTLFNTKTPIRIASNVSDQWNYFSTSQIMRMDVEKALETGGTYDSLVATMKREGDSGQGGESATKARHIRTPETFSSILTDLHEGIDFMMTSKDGRGLHAGVKKLLEGANSDDFILSMYDVVQTFNSFLYANDRMSARVEQVVSGREEANKPDAA